MPQNVVEVALEQQEDYRFAIRFGGTVPELTGDEPPPLGAGSGPSPVQLLAAAVGNCLSNSLLFALRKFKQAPEPIRTRVRAEIDRNAQNRLRVTLIAVEITLGASADALAHLERALAQFEEFCTVTQSVRQGIPVTIEVRDAGGRKVHR